MRLPWPCTMRNAVKCLMGAETPPYYLFHPRMIKKFTHVPVLLSASSSLQSVSLSFSSKRFKFSAASRGNNKSWRNVNLPSAGETWYHDKEPMSECFRGWADDSHSHTASVVDPIISVKPSPSTFTPPPSPPPQQEPVNKPETDVLINELMSSVLLINRRRSLHATRPFEWIDIMPKSAEKQKLSKNKKTSAEDRAAVIHAMRRVMTHYGAHETLVADVLEPTVLPQSVTINNISCLILRSFKDDIPSATSPVKDRHGAPSSLKKEFVSSDFSIYRQLGVASGDVCREEPMDGESMERLTARVTILILPNKIVTIHRYPLSWIKAIHNKFEERLKTASVEHFLNVIVKRCVMSYDNELARAIVDFDTLETKLFEEGFKDRRALAQAMYIIKRRSTVCFRVVHMTENAYAHAAASHGVKVSDIHFQVVMQHIAHVKSLAEEMKDNATNVLALLFQLSSFQLNELMRVLTLFSAFFIPLSFVASFYGMNFENLPLVEHEYGKHACIFIMLGFVATLATFLRFRKLL